MKPIHLTRGLAVFALLLPLACTSLAQLAPRPAPPETAPPQPPAPTAAPATPAPPPTFTPQPALSEAQLANLAYTLPDWHEQLPDGRLLLQNGQFSAEQPGFPAPITARLQQYTAGDLNGDGAPDAAVLLAVNTGGTGVFTYLAAVLNQGGQPQPLPVVFIADRPAVQAFGIQPLEGEPAAPSIRLELLVAGPADPACCPATPETQVYTLEAGRLVSGSERAIRSAALDVLRALKAQDWAALAALAHPDQGVRFSPYPYVRPEDLVFQPAQLAVVWETSTIFVWGNFDGSGEPIQLTFPQYYERFIYSKDFAAAPQVSYDRPIGFGNTIDNARQFYPGALIAEFHFPGSEQYSGMDWQSLRLVFQRAGGRWLLVGIIHAEWTI